MCPNSIHSNKGVPTSSPRRPPTPPRHHAAQPTKSMCDTWKCDAKAAKHHSGTLIPRKGIKYSPQNASTPDAAPAHLQASVAPP